MVNARLAGSLRQREELGAGADGQEWQGSLVARYRHAEQPLVERHRALLIRHEDGEVIDLAECDQAVRRRGLRRVAELAQQAVAAAVGVVLQLHDHPVRIGDIELRGSVGMPAELGAAHPDADGGRARLGRLTDPADAMLAEDADQAFGIEVVDRQTRVIDVRLNVGAPAAERDELRTVAHLQNQRLRLTGGQREAEQALVELE